MWPPHVTTLMARGSFGAVHLAAARPNFEEPTNRSDHIVNVAVSSLVDTCHQRHVSPDTCVTRHLCDQRISHNIQETCVTRDMSHQRISHNIQAESLGFVRLVACLGLDTQTHTRTHTRTQTPTNAKARVM